MKVSILEQTTALFPFIKDASDAHRRFLKIYYLIIILLRFDVSDADAALIFRALCVSASRRGSAPSLK